MVPGAVGETDQSTFSRLSAKTLRPLSSNIGVNALGKHWSGAKVNFCFILVLYNAVLKVRSTKVQ